MSRLNEQRSDQRCQEKQKHEEEDVKPIYGLCLPHRIWGKRYFYCLLYLTLRNVTILAHSMLPRFWFFFFLLDKCTKTEINLFKSRCFLFNQSQTGREKHPTRAVTQQTGAVRTEPTSPTCHGSTLLPGCRLVWTQNNIQQDSVSL